MKTMQPVMQLHLHFDADIGGKCGNDHSYLGYLANDLIFWCSADQRSVFSYIAESEIGTLNNTLKVEVANRGILNTIGWAQNQTLIEEDDQACCVYHSKSHMTHNLRHPHLSESYIKDKVADGKSIIAEVNTADDNSGIGITCIKSQI
jgi:hypothetical protein